MPQANRLANLRVLIAHDWLVTWGGAERCVEQMLAVLPQADVVVGVLAPELRTLDTAMTTRARETWLGRLPGARKRYRWFAPLEGLAFASCDTSRYDLVISSCHSFAKAIRAAAGVPHLCYCYSPPRYLWDMRVAYERDATPAQRFALEAGAGLLRWYDKRTANRVNQFVAISEFVADRIRRTYGRPSTVLYPPVECRATAHVGLSERQDYILSLGRLVPYKRVDLAIEAAKRLGVKLIIAGEGPDRARLESLADSTVEWRGWVSEAEAGRLLSGCRAFVFCAEEDFGIAPVEANAHGAPVVGYAKGGLLETMVQGETAEFFYEQTADALTGALERALARPWDPAAARSNAARFGPERFRREFASAVASALDAGWGGPR